MQFNLPLRSRLIAGGLIAALVLNLLPAFAQAQNQTPKLRAGDGVRILVWKEDISDNQVKPEELGLNGDYLLDEQGSILLPSLGEVKAAGQSPKGLADNIQQSLRIKAIRIVCLPLIRVTLLGAVQRPGSYLVQPKESLWELINKAGGPANDADFRKIKVMRSGSVVKSNLLEAFEKAHSLEGLAVESGDQIIVPGLSGFSFGDVIRYATFAMSVGVFYLQLSNDNR
ncbi:MAG: polysaccharide biosynthesis/export family protein [candidate division KSB1 bacterium]